MAGAGYRTFQSGEVLTANNVQTYLMDQAVQVYSGTAARSSAVPSPSTGMVAYSTATGLQVFNGSAWTNVSTGYGVATGGASTAITVAGTAYTLLTFNSDSSLVVTTAGLFDVLLVGGGAAGGSARSNWGTGGGGGGGGVMQQTIYLTAATYSIDVGAPGAESSTSPSTREGKESAIYSATNFGIAVSGGGASASPFLASSGSSSGATGGGAKNGGTGSPGSSFGFAGGNGGTSGTYDGGGGGGGGAGAIGTNGSGSTGGNGGAGVEINTFISGASSFRGGGGAGGGNPAGSAGSGNGSANTGGGGKGGRASTNENGLVGYSGAVFVRFKV